MGVNEAFSQWCLLRCLYSFLSIIFRAQEGELDAVAVVHSYEDGMPAGSHKTRLTALNVCLLLKDLLPSIPYF